MNYSERHTRLLNIASIAMLCYAVVALITLRITNFPYPGVLLFLIIIVNFLLALFKETNKILTACVCILVGFLSMWLLPGVIFWFGLVLGIYGIFWLILLLITD